MAPRIEAGDFEALVRDACSAGAFIGHRAQKRTLFKWMDSAYEKREPVLLLAGPTGSGKTRLARTAVLRARRREYAACTGACEAVGGPYSPFVKALQDAAAGPLPDPVRKRLEAHLDARPELAELMGRRSAAESRFFDRSVGRDTLYQSLAHALLLLASKGPALLIVEDLHLADETSLDFLKYLAARSRMHRLRVLVTCRTGQKGALPGRLKRTVEGLDRAYGITRIELGGLTRQETDALIRSVCKKHLFTDALRQGLHRGTGGNPSAILEALRLFQAQGIIYEEMGVWKERRSLAPSDTAIELYKTVADRLERLQPEVVRCLRLAAVCGQRFDPDVVERAMGVKRVRFKRILGVIARIHGVIAPAEQGYEFTSDMLREVLYLRIPQDVLPALHLALAQGFEQVYADRPEEAAEALAEHYSRGGDMEKALPYLVEAGERARKFSAEDRAVAYFGRALSALEGREQDCDTIDLKLSLLKSIASVLTKLKRWEEAEARLRALIGLSGRYSDHCSEAEAWKRIGLIYAKRKHFDQALSLYERSLQIFLQEKDPAGECDVVVKIGQVYLQQGRWEDLQRTYNSALRIARDLEKEELIADILMNIAIMYGLQGDISRTLPTCNRCLEIYRRLGLWEKVTAGLLNIGKFLSDHGNYAEAKKHYAACLKLARQQHDILHEALVQLNLSEILLAEGELERCRRMCEGALKRFEEIDNRICIADAHRILGCVAAREQDSGEAVAHFEQSIDLNRETGCRLGEAEACRDYALFLLDNGCIGPMDELFAQARAIFAELKVEKEVKRIDSITARHELVAQ